MLGQGAFRQHFSDSAWQMYGPYLEADRDRFSLGVDSPAGCALVSAQTRVVELELPDGPPERLELPDDWLAYFVVSKAVEQHHVSLSDLPPTFVPIGKTEES